ncbi:MAG: terminase [Patescibacteria group bacterium]|nr:terminase [Patescibacteria group bacterium]
MTQTIDNPELQLAQDIAGFSRDPFSYSMYAFPWGDGELSQYQGPRKWQRDILLQIRDHLSGPNRFMPLRIAIASGNGIGKSCLISMLTSWALDTCEDSRVLITANTEPQLRTKTWPEVTKWKNLAITKHWWDVGATSIRSAVADHSNGWRADMTTWNVKNPSAFQGLHNVGKRILIVFDEASGIPQEIWDACVGCETDANTEIIRLSFGNPLNSTGPFRECFGAKAHRWSHYHIDSRAVEGTNKALFDQWVADYGEDSDLVRVRVRGEFPRVASTQFIAQDDVTNCRKYKADDKIISGLPKILGVDVARFGDDRSSIMMRQGRKSTMLLKVHGLSTAEMAERVIEQWQKLKPDGVVVDGDGLGAGVVDHLRYRGFSKGLHEFHGAERPMDAAMYANRRAEIWGKMRDWLSADAELPDDPEIEQDLTGVQYGMNGRGQIQLEKKSDMKSRGLASPDIGDALALTFAVSVKARPKQYFRDSVTPYGANSWMA